MVTVMPSSCLARARAGRAACPGGGDRRGGRCGQARMAFTYGDDLAAPEPLGSEVSPVGVV